MNSQNPAMDSLSFRNRRFTRPTFLFFVFLVLLLALFAGLRSGDWVTDLYGYRAWYAENYRIQELLAKPALAFQRDPAYFFLTSFFLSIKVPFELFLFGYALVCVSLKVKGIVKMSNAPYWSLLLYGSTFYMLHELVQIRAGAASALFLLGIPFLVQGRRTAYVLLILLASCFHYSALTLLPLAFLQNQEEKPRWYLIILLLSLIGAASGVTLSFLIQHLPGADADARMAIYLLEAENNFTAVHIFNRVSIPNFLLAVALLLNFKELKNRTPYASHIIRIFTLSQIIFYIFSGFAIFAFRLSELMGVVSIIAWPLAGYLIRRPWLRTLLFTAVILNFLSATVQIFNPIV
jgi:hypothetical protein